VNRPTRLITVPAFVLIAEAIPPGKREIAQGLLGSCR